MKKTNMFEGILLGLLLAFCLLAPTAAYHQLAHGADGESGNTSQGVSTGYKLDRQTALWRTGVSGADATVVDSSFLTAQLFAANGRQNIPVTAHFDNAGANCVVRWVGIAVDPGQGTRFFADLSAPVTLTASAITDGAGKYVAPTYVFDSYGASHGRLLVVSVSAGNVHFGIGSY